MKRLYWTNPEVFEAEVEVKLLDDKVHDNKLLDHNKVTIDPVIFHPDEGGQPSDKGAIGAATVLKVEIVEGKIVHTLDKPLAGGKHLARLDKKHRLYTASQHTAQHIISGIAQRQFNLETTGVHIGAERCTVDFDQKTDEETLTDLERLSNEIVTLNLPIETLFNDTEVRIRGEGKEIEADMMRVVKIGDIDKSACCGAHRANTGQVGIIRIFDFESKKKGTRVYFLAGQKALEFSQSETAVLREMRKLIRCATADLPAMVQKALDESGRLNKEINQLWAMKLSELVKSAEIIEIESSKIGIQVVEIPSKLMTRLAAMIAGDVKGAGIVVSGVNVAISSHSLDAGSLLKRIQQKAGGKGGGSAQAANGVLERALSVDELKLIMTGG
jgi:alanyl-tRNA synthetase